MFDPWAASRFVIPAKTSTLFSLQLIDLEKKGVDARRRGHDGVGVFRAEFESQRLRRVVLHNIQCEFVGSCERNRVLVREGERATRALLLSFGGNDNIVELQNVPNGIIHFVSHGSECSVNGGPRTVEIDLWLYERAKFLLGDASVVFGLAAWVYNGTKLSIGRDCLLSDEISILTSDHHSLIDLETGKQFNFPANVTLCDHTWIGKGATILKDVEIGQGSVVATRALVTDSVLPKQLWGGVPARCLRKNVSWVASHPANPEDILRLKALVG